MKYRGAFIVIVAGVCVVGVAAVPPQQSASPGADGVKADPTHYKLLYEDDHVRLVEVTHRPHEQAAVSSGDPYYSVLAFPSIRPPVKEVQLDGATAEITNLSPPPPKMSYPLCAAVAPRAPYRSQNLGDFPDHYYRIDYKRVDGADFTTHWEEWYPYLKQRMTVEDWIKSSGKRPFGQATDTNPKRDADKITLNPTEYHYPDSMDSVSIAPGQHWLRFENRNVRFIEVIYRAGERGDALHSHAYASVFGHDIDFARGSDEFLDDKRPARDLIGIGSPPPGMQHPSCWTMGPQPPHRPHNLDTRANHFYRIEFKRLDGDAFKDRWREWYPEMN